jgi:hypothetical protein
MVQIHVAQPKNVHNKVERPHRLVAQDNALSRRRRRFKPAWGRHTNAKRLYHHGMTSFFMLYFYGQGGEELARGLGSLHPKRHVLCAV